MIILVAKTKGDRFLADGAIEYIVKPIGIAQIEMIFSKYFG